MDIFILTLVLKSMVPPHPAPFPHLLGLDDEIQARLQIPGLKPSTDLDLAKEVPRPGEKENF